jgi:hypothetical protein
MILFVVVDMAACFLIILSNRDIQYPHSDLQ